MSTSKRPTGAYYNLSAGTLTTSPKDGSLGVVYHEISHFLITKRLVPVWCLLAYQRRHWNGLVLNSVDGAPGMHILILDYGVWCKTSCTASPEPPLRLMQCMSIPMGISCRRKTLKPYKTTLDRGAYRAALRDTASRWSWASVISRVVKDDPNAFVLSSANLIRMLDQLRLAGSTDKFSG